MQYVTQDTASPRGPKNPLEAAKEAVKSISQQISSLQARVTQSELSERSAERELESNQDGLRRAREETAKAEARVAELAAALVRAREELQNSRNREEAFQRGIDKAGAQLREAKEEKKRSLSQHSAAANAQKHLEESFQYLEQMSSADVAGGVPPVVEQNPLSASQTPVRRQTNPSSAGDWPWDEETSAAGKEKEGLNAVIRAASASQGDANADPVSMPNPYTDEPVGEADNKSKKETSNGKGQLTIEEKAKREEMAARVAAVQRSKREKEAILQARLANKAKLAMSQATTAQPPAAAKAAPPNVVLKTSELLNLQRKKNEEHLAEMKKSLQQQQQQQQSSHTPRPAAKPEPDAGKKSADSSPVKVIRVPSTAQEARGGASCSDAPTPPPAAPEEVVTRDDVRNELEEKFYAFMPQQHEFREASKGSVPERSRAPPGGLCNRHCSRNCLKSCTAGFLLANDIPVKATSSSGKVGLDELFQTVSKAMRKFHPDRNSVRRVGLARSMYCEEVCKDLSLLQSLMETTNEVTFVLLFGNSDMPKMRVTMPLSATVSQLKKRIVDDYNNLNVSSLTLRVGGVDMKDAKTLGSCGIKENCIVNVQASAKGWTSF